MSDLFGSTPPQQQGYVTSPQQEQLFSIMMPLMQEWANKGFAELGPQQANIPAAPATPSFPGVTGAQFTAPQTPSVPDISSMMPTQGWYEGIAPGIKEAVWEPYMEGADILREQLGGIGSLGNQRAGMSGAAADVFSDYMGKATPQVTKSLWDMTSPALQAGWGAEMGLTEQGYGAGLQGALTQQQQDFTGAMGQFGAETGLTTDLMSSGYNADLQGALAQQQQAYAAQIDPYALLMGGMPTAIPDTYFAPEGRDPGLIGSLFK